MSDDILDDNKALSNNIEHFTNDDSHTRINYLYAFSRLMERAGYYGIKVIFVLYLVTNNLQTRVDAISTYTLFTSFIIGSEFLGALLGDIIIGNKKTLIIGGVLQSLGALILCIPNNGIEVFYLGIILIGIGSGLYSPNLLAQFSKSYLNKTKLMDAGFTMLFLAINIGSFAGVLLISFAGEINYSLGFGIGAAFMIVATFIAHYAKDKESFNIPTISNRSISKAGAILLVFLLFIFYSAIEEFTGMPITEIKMSLTKNIPYTFQYLLDGSLIIFILYPIAIYAWTRYNIKSVSKIAIGFLVGAIGYLVFIFQTDILSSNSVGLFLLAMLFLGIAELLIFPIIYSIIAKNSNPKFLAITFSMIRIPIFIANLIAGTFVVFMDTSGGEIFKIAAISMGVIGSIMFILLATKK